MQKIGVLSNSREVKHIAYLLNRQGIEHDIQQHNQTFEVWIKNEQHVAQAKNLLEPAQPPQSTASATADAKEPPPPPGVITVLLMAICIVAFVLYHAGVDVYVWLMMSVTPVGLHEIQQGQIWRLLTPIFLHAPIYDFYSHSFNVIYIFHIVFNLLWLFQLGSLIESNETSRRLLLLVMTIGIVANFAQYLASGAFFFGMSGVVYGLLGYLWTLSRFAYEQTGYYVNSRIMLLMVAWLLFCYTGALGNIANAAHLSGLLMGIVLGFWAKRVGAKEHPEH